MSAGWKPLDTQNSRSLLVCTKKNNWTTVKETIGWIFGVDDDDDDTFIVPRTVIAQTV
jgi:hypothetical protein